MANYSINQIAAAVAQVLNQMDNAEHSFEQNAQRPSRRQAAQQQNNANFRQMQCDAFQLAQRAPHTIAAGVIDGSRTEGAKMHNTDPHLHSEYLNDEIAEFGRFALGGSQLDDVEHVVRVYAKKHEVVLYPNEVTLDKITGEKIVTRGARNGIHASYRAFITSMRGYERAQPFPFLGGAQGWIKVQDPETYKWISIPQGATFVMPDYKITGTDEDGVETTFQPGRVRLFVANNTFDGLVSITNPKNNSGRKVMYLLKQQGIELFAEPEHCYTDLCWFLAHVAVFEHRHSINSAMKSMSMGAIPDPKYATRQEREALIELRKKLYDSLDAFRAHRIANAQKQAEYNAQRNGNGQQRSSNSESNIPDELIFDWDDESSVEGGESDFMNEISVPAPAVQQEQRGRSRQRNDKQILAAASPVKPQDF